MRLYRDSIHQRHATRVGTLFPRAVVWSCYICHWLACTLLFTSPLHAANVDWPYSNVDWRYCGEPKFNLSEKPRGLMLQPSSEVSIEADKITAKNHEILDLSGDVKFKNEAGTVSTDAATYQISQQRLTTSSGIRFDTDYLITIGDSASLTVGNREGSIEHARFWLPRSHMRGSADKLTLVNQHETRLQQTFFTSCLEGENDWVLRASELTVDTSKNEGVAKHARLTFKSVPIFYFPYLSFALEGRKTGLLTPAIGNTNKTGRHLTLPYYINIAPNRDATITPHFYQKRGVMIQTENRFLFPTTYGELEFDYLNDDKVSDPTKRSDRRFYSDFNMSSYPAHGWQTEIIYRRVSDDAYFSDFGEGYLQANESYLERSANASFQGQDWEFSAAVKNYQTIDSAIQPLELPYQLLPSLHVNLREHESDLGLRYKMDMEYVRFHRSQGVVARRLDIAPRISWPLTRNGGYITPSVKMRHTKYALSREGKIVASQPIAIDPNPQRSVSQYTLDSGLFLERDLEIGGTKHIHTLEPRLYYLYIPYREQRNMIVEENGQEVTFDAGQPQLTYSQLFRDNRFNGIDKIGDANQITLALSSRLITDKGLERMRFSIGQIRYLQDREVNLPNQDPLVLTPPPVQTNDQSDIVVEFSSQWNRHIHAQATYVWGAVQRFTQSGHYRIRYQHDADNMVSVNYRYEKGVEEQADATVLGQIRSQWNGLAHVRYSFIGEQSPERLETFIGLEYQSCCWSMRVLQREYLTGDGVTRNNSTWLQLELKGLTRVAWS